MSLLARVIARFNAFQAQGFAAIAVIVAAIAVVGAAIAVVGAAVAV